jgi:hypothetical protein
MLRVMVTYCVIEILILVAEMLILVKWHVLGNCLIKLLILSIELLMRAESQYNDNGGFIQCYFVGFNGNISNGLILNANLVIVLLPWH